MKLPNYPLALIAACLVLISSTPSMAATPQPVISEAGIAYVVGGVGTDERQAMRSAYKHYKLRVEVAEKGGAYTADMQLKLLKPDGQTLVDVLIDGPWLLVDVPSGEYVLAVVKDGRHFRQKIKLGNEAQQHVVFVWPKVE